MTSLAILLHLLGAVALLVWATRMVKTGIVRGFEPALRRIIRGTGGSRLGACATGVGVATALQSSTATGLLLAAFVDRGMIALAPALAVMLGADIGSTIVVQILTFDLSLAIPVLLLAGVLTFLNGPNARTRQLGRIAIGLALMILSLGMIVDASLPLRESPLLDLVLQNVIGEPVMAVLIGALMTWLVHSSVAMVLLFMTLVGAAVLPLAVAIPLVLGANIGSGLIPLGLTARSSSETRRFLYGNLAFRMTGALAVIAVVPWLVEPLAGSGLAPERSVAAFHTAFNIALAIVFLPLTGLAARLLQRAVPDQPAAIEPASPVHLDDALFDRPAMALGAATREIMRLADIVESMLRDAIRTFETNPVVTPETVSSQDDLVDALEEAIKLYLTRLGRGDLEESQQARCRDLIVFTTNLEHIGDIVDKSLLPLARKKRREHLTFSDDGWEEINDLHELVIEQMRLAVLVFVNRDAAMARELVRNKDIIRNLERQAVDSHLARLRDGTVESIESSSVHLDVIRDLKRINSHIAVTAYPILESLGKLRKSRLKSA